MANLIDKAAVLAEIERLRALLPDANDCDCLQLEFARGQQDAFTDFEVFIRTLEVKEVDLELITGWFDHIAQIADDRMTLTNQRMTDSYALDEIKCIAKNSSEFITKYYKAQKGE